MSDILTEAQDILKQRAEQYGSATDCFRVIASYWNEYMNNKMEYELKDACKDWDGTWNYAELIEAHDVAMLMVLMKLARATTGQKHKDNYIDIIGYAALAGDL